MYDASSGELGSSLTSLLGSVCRCKLGSTFSRPFPRSGASRAGARPSCCSQDGTHVESERKRVKAVQ